MASRSPAAPSRQHVLPDLPADLFSDDDDLYGDLPRKPRSSTRARPAPEPHPIRTGRAGLSRRDVVTSVTMRPESTKVFPARQPRPRTWAWTQPVLPAPMQMIGQAFPNWLMALSTGLVLLLGTFTPLGVPVWAAGIFVPSVILAWSAVSARHLPWKRAAMINIATMAMVFPVLVIRQSVVRIPFVDGSNGTLMAPAIATTAVVGLLLVLALACAVLSQEDPEYSATLFLPAAMMVPLLAGQSDLVSLSSALVLATGIFAIAGMLTIIASVLPAAFPSLIAPATIGLEFVLLTVFRSTSIFPVGAGNTAKVLFFVIVVATLALAILVPMVSVWVRQVTRLAQSRSMAAPTTAS